MKEPYIEGLATHDDPESCGCIPQGSSRSVDRGTCGLGIEPRNRSSQGADGVTLTGRRNEQAQERESLLDPARSETPRTHGSLRTRNWEILGSPAEDGTAGRIGKAKSRNPVMHDARKSDDSVVSKKSPNKGGSPSVEGMEKRESTKGTRTSESRAGHRAGEACQASWSACEKQQRRTGRRGSRRCFTTSRLRDCGRATWRCRTRRQPEWMG